MRWFKTLNRRLHNCGWVMERVEMIEKLYTGAPSRIRIVYVHESGCNQVDVVCEPNRDNTPGKILAVFRNGVRMEL